MKGLVAQLARPHRYRLEYPQIKLALHHRWDSQSQWLNKGEHSDGRERYPVKMNGRMELIPGMDGTGKKWAVKERNDITSFMGNMCKADTKRLTMK